jgi:hypothetical protein
MALFLVEMDLQCISSGRDFAIWKWKLATGCNSLKTRRQAARLLLQRAKLLRVLQGF